MFSCSICGKKATRAHPVLKDDHICKNCFEKISEDYRLHLCNSITSVDDKQDNDSQDVLIRDTNETCTKKSSEYELIANLTQASNAGKIQKKHDFKDTLRASLAK